MNYHFHLLINPAAGSGNAEKTAKKIMAVMDERRYAYTPYATSYAGEEKEILAKIAEQLSFWNEAAPNDAFHLLIVIGGDGTLHEVVNQLFFMEKNVPVSYIPAGSGNDFARGIGLSRDPIKALEQIVQAREPQRISSFYYEEKISREKGLVLNNIGIGLDALVVALTNTSTSKKWLNKYHLGSASYLLCLLKALLTQKTFPILVEINGKQLDFQRVFLCTTTNIPYFGGGIAIAPMADAKKRRIDLVIVEKPNPFAILHFLLQLVRKKQTKNKRYHHFSSSRAHIVSVIPQHGQVDGETMGKRSFDLYFSTHTQLFWYRSQGKM